jgi:hypothetical protein
MAPAPRAVERFILPVIVPRMVFSSKGSGDKGSDKRLRLPIAAH